MKTGEEILKKFRQNMTKSGYPEIEKYTDDEIKKAFLCFADLLNNVGLSAAQAAQTLKKTINS